MYNLSSSGAVGGDCSSGDGGVGSSVAMTIVGIGESASGEDQSSD